MLFLSVRILWIERYLLWMICLLGGVIFGGCFFCYVRRVLVLYFVRLYGVWWDENNC